MNHIALLFYQSLILCVFYRLGQCEEFAYNFDIVRLSIKGGGLDERRWESATLSKFSLSNSFIFQDDELIHICGGALSPSDVEIVEIFDRELRFSLIRRTNNLQLFFNVLFLERSSVQLFFRFIRWQQREGCNVVNIEALFQYQIRESENQIIDLDDNENPLKLLSHNLALYTKDLSAAWFADPISFSFVYYGLGTQPQEVFLVLLSKTFNISDRFDTNKVLLCTRNTGTHMFIVRFARSLHLRSFYRMIRNNLDDQIPCSARWVTPGLLQDLNSRFPFTTYSR